MIYSPARKGRFNSSQELPAAHCGRVRQFKFYFLPSFEEPIKTIHQRARATMEHLNNWLACAISRQAHPAFRFAVSYEKQPSSLLCPTSNIKNNRGSLKNKEISARDKR
jgi:hypothetical protein